MNKDLESAIFRLEAIVNQPRIAFSIPTNEAEAILEALKPTECVHPYKDVYGAEFGMGMICHKCGALI